jgi:hypothetical protein
MELLRSVSVQHTACCHMQAPYTLHAVTPQSLQQSQALDAIIMSISDLGL